MQSCNHVYQSAWAGFVIQISREGLTCMVPGAEGASCTSRCLGSPYVLHLCMFVADLGMNTPAKRLTPSWASLGLYCATWTLFPCELCSNFIMEYQWNDFMELYYAAIQLNAVAMYILHWTPQHTMVTSGIHGRPVFWLHLLYWCIFAVHSTRLSRIPW